MYASAFKVGMAAPDDVSEAAKLLKRKAFRAEEVVAILGKTEGNGGVNDYTRALATLSFQHLLSRESGISVEQIALRVPIIWSGGTEGLMSPHATIFTRRDQDGGEGESTPSPTLPTRGRESQKRFPTKGRENQKRFTVGTAYTRDLKPEEFGTLEHVRVAAEGVRRGIADAGITDSKDIHFIQIKTGALTTERVREAMRRGQEVVTTDTYKSMAYARAVAALGIGLATGELPRTRVSERIIGKDMSIYSEIASTSSGIELMNCEIIVLGNCARSSSELVMAHAMMRDAIDAEGVRRALRAAGLKVACELAAADRPRLINVFAKCEPDLGGATRGRRHVMFEDSDIGYTRHIRAVVNAVVASVTGDTMAYISAGAEHQGPPGGGVVAVLARVG
jgi:cyanuric acid amidohydrolase